MKITKQYIQENLLTVRGLNSNLTRKLSETTEELYLIYNDTETPRCLGNNPAKFKSFTKGYIKQCGDMTCECYKERYKKTQIAMKKQILKDMELNVIYLLRKIKLKKEQLNLKNTVQKPIITPNLFPKLS